MGKFVADFHGQVKTWREGQQLYVSLQGGHLRNPVSLSVKASGSSGAELEHHILMSRLTPQIEALKSAIDCKVEVDGHRVTVHFGHGLSDWGSFTMSYADGLIHLDASGNPRNFATPSSYQAALHLYKMIPLLGWPKALGRTSNNLLGLLMSVLIAHPRIGIFEHVHMDKSRDIHMRLEMGKAAYPFLITVDDEDKVGVVMERPSRDLLDELAYLRPLGAFFISLSKGLAEDGAIALLPNVYDVRRSGRDVRVINQDMIYTVVAHDPSSFFTSTTDSEPKDARPASFRVHRGRDSWEMGEVEMNNYNRVWKAIGLASRVNSEMEIAEVEISFPEGLRDRYSKTERSEQGTITVQLAFDEQTQTAEIRTEVFAAANSAFCVLLAFVALTDVVAVVRLLDFEIDLDLYGEERSAMQAQAREALESAVTEWLAEGGRKNLPLQVSESALRS